MRNPHKTHFSRCIQRHLVWAVHNRDADAVQQLIANSTPKDIELALHNAYWCNDLDCLEILAPYAGVECNSWALIAAASQGHAEAVRILIPHSDPRTSNSLALKMALVSSHWGCVDLLKNHCPLVACNNALHRAIKNNDHTTFEKIVACTAPITTDTPLIWAACFGHHQLLAKIISISVLKNINSEALTTAAHYGHPKCVELLIGLSDRKEFPNVLAEAFIGAYVERCFARSYLEPLVKANPKLKPDDEYVCVFDMLSDSNTLHNTHCILFQKCEQAAHNYKERWNTCMENFEIWSAQCQRNNLLEHIGSQGTLGVRKM